MIPRLAIVKTLNYGTTIWSWHKILKIGNFYHFQVQSSQEVRILAKNLSTAKNSDLSL